MNILYLGWVGANNIGDELMLSNFKSISKEKYGDKNIIKGIYPDGDLSEFNDYDMICLGGGSILVEGFIDIMYNFMEKGKKVMVWGSGYDELLGRDFIDRLENTKISPYIYSDGTEVKLNEIAKNAEFFGVRGPLTYKILEKSNIDVSNIKISGDPGFLLKSELIDDMDTIIDFNKNDNVVAVNIGTSYNRIYGNNEKKLLDDLSVVCNRLISLGYRIYLYSLWRMDFDVQIDLYRNIAKKDSVILDLTIHKGEQLKSIIEKCIFSINFKLHGNVISATANTPFICVGYRLKAYDWIKSIDSEELNVPTDSENIQDEILKKVNYIEDNGKDIIDKINRKVEAYKGILRDSF